MSYKILIVEDDKEIADSLADIIEIMEHEVVNIVDNYNDAIDKLEIVVLNVIEQDTAGHAPEIDRPFSA